MALRLTTRSVDSLRTRAVAPGAFGMADMGGQSSGDGAQPAFNAGGMDSVSQSISDYLADLTAQQERDLRTQNPWADIAIRKRMDDLRDQAWTVGPIDARHPVNKDIVASIRSVLEQPNAALENNSFGGLWGAAMNDVYTIGRGAVQALQNSDGTARAFRVLDPARMHYHKGWDPNKPLDGIRWNYDKTIGEAPVELRSDEVIMLVPYTTSTDRSGLSPMKSLQTILRAELDTRRKMWLTQKYGTPPGVFIMPGAAPGSPQRMRLLYDLKMAGRNAIGFMNLPKDSKFIEFGGINLISQGTFKFYEILVRCTAAAFGTTPFFLGWTDQDSYANSKTQLTVTDRGGIAQMKFVRQIINRDVIGPFRTFYGSKADNIWFTFDALRAADGRETPDAVKTRIGEIGYISINDARDAAGWPIYQRNDVPPEIWPFLNEMWIPSRLPGVMLPLSYAAMSFGITLSVKENDPLNEVMTQLAANNASPLMPTSGRAPTVPEIDPDEEEPEIAKALRTIHNALSHGDNAALGDLDSAGREARLRVLQRSSRHTT